MLTSRAIRLVVLACAPLQACGGDASAIEYPACAEVISTTPVGAAEQTAHGTPAEVAQETDELDPQLLSYRESPGGAARAASATFQLVQDLAGATVVKRRTQRTGAMCDDLLRIPATLTLRSQDGALADDFEGVLSKDASQLRFDAQKPVADIMGSYSPVGFPAAFSILKLNMFVTGSRSSGQLSLDAPAGSGSSATSGDAASW